MLEEISKTASSIELGAASSAQVAPTSLPARVRIQGLPVDHLRLIHDLQELQAFDNIALASIEGALQCLRQRLNHQVEVLALNQDFSHRLQTKHQSARQSPKQAHRERESGRQVCSKMVQLICIADRSKQARRLLVSNLSSLFTSSSQAIFLQLSIAQSRTAMRSSIIGNHRTTSIMVTVFRHGNTRRSTRFDPGPMPAYIRVSHYSPNCFLSSKVPKWHSSTH